MACAILKVLQYIEDTTGNPTTLHYLRTKDGKELDFIICINNKPLSLIEVKASDDEPVKEFDYFSRYFPQAVLIQLVKDLHREKTYSNGLAIRSLVPWLTHLKIIP